MGMIYKPKYKDKEGNTRQSQVYWIKYYRNGKPYRESTKSTKEADAKRLLKRREGEISKGKLPGIYFDRVRFDELAEDFLRDYKVNNKKTLIRAEQFVSNLKEVFEGMKVVDITTPLIEKYIEGRMQKVQNATINRELAALKRMLNLGAKRTPPKVDRVPYIPRLKENNARKGFFEHGDYIALKDALPDYLKGFITFGYKTGWRISEIRDLTWNQVDRNQGIVRLEVGDTKNEEARTVYLDEELKQIFQKQWEKRRKTGRLIPYVFLNEKGTDKTKDFRKAWSKACKASGVGKKLFHDLRRTAVRNMVRAGVPERVAMMVSGHKTRSVFQRYNIVSDTDLRLASQKQEEYLKLQIGKVSGKVAEFDKKKRLNDNA